MIALFISVYAFGFLVFLCIWSTEKACAMLHESLWFVVAMSVLWPIMLLHVIPFGLKCLLDPKTWRE